MSYNLMVFEKKKAPQTKAEFMKWFEKLAAWEEDVDYDEYTHTSQALQNWFLDIINVFPPMNGTLAPSDEEIDENEELEERTTDYCIATDAIYAAFAWSKAEEAYETMRKMAVKHNVGFFDVSGNGDIILPNGDLIK